MLLLHESPAHGYELRERLRPLGFNRDDPGRLYRALRALEDAELVSSAWQASAGGPDRRTYELTRAGEERLLEAVAELQAMHAVLDRFLLRCIDTASPVAKLSVPFTASVVSVLYAAAPTTTDTFGPTAKLAPALIVKLPGRT